MNDTQMNDQVALVQLATRVLVKMHGLDGAAEQIPKIAPHWDAAFDGVLGAIEWQNIFYRELAKLRINSSAKQPF